MLYDSLVLVLNHAPIPRSQENGPEEESTDQDGKAEQVYNGDEISQLFNECNENDNGPFNGEEALRKYRCFNILQESMT